MLKGKTIVVTGCLQGIGLATLHVFAKNHANVIACSYKKDVEFEKQCETLSKENEVQIFPIYFDMANNDAIKEAAKEIMRLKMDIYGLVNIAGINRDAFFSMITMQDIRDTFQVNVFSQIVFTQYIVKMMRRKQIQGSIAFTSSITALDGALGQVAYGASKAALIGAMRSMALELGAFGIRVNAVAPGVIKTPMTASLQEEIKENSMRTMDIPRFGEPEEVANLFLYLMSDFSTHMTGQIVRIDGGIR